MTDDEIKKFCEHYPAHLREAHAKRIREELDAEAALGPGETLSYPPGVNAADVDADPHHPRHRRVKHRVGERLT